MDLSDSELYWTRKKKGLATEKKTEEYIRSLEKKIKELEENYIPKSLVRENIKELEKKDREIQIKNNYLDLIWQIGYDYDGLNKVESLKELIDELVDYAIKAKKNDDKSVIYEGNRGKEIIVKRYKGDTQILHRLSRRRLKRELKREVKEND